MQQILVIQKYISGKLITDDELAFLKKDFLGE
jgi:hypothetical protein